MPQRPAAKKSVKRNKKREHSNKRVKSRLTTETRKFERAVEREDTEEAQEQLDLVTKLLHQAASKGVIHENKAARRQSQLQKSLDRISQDAE